MCLLTSCKARVLDVAVAVSSRDEVLMVSCFYLCCVFSLIFCLIILHLYIFLKKQRIFFSSLFFIMIYLFSSSFLIPCSLFTKNKTTLQHPFIPPLSQNFFSIMKFASVLRTLYTERRHLTRHILAHLSLFSSVTKHTLAPVLLQQDRSHSQ